MPASTSEVFWGEIAPCEHLLQIYENDAVFLDTLEGFVAGGLRSDEASVVIATREHLDALERRMEAAGLDVAGALAHDQYIPLDAEQTLSKFMVNGWPDAGLFAETVAQILARARGASGRRVRAFGEMVALLWARDLTAATIRLEHLWTKLCHENGFSLFCAYPKTGITRGPSQSLTEICAAHTKVIAGG